MGYRYGPVVVVGGVDGSADSIGALRSAADEAHRCIRELITVHVPPDGAGRSEYPPDRPGVAAQAAAEARRWLPGIYATAATETGTAAEVLRRYSQQFPLVDMELRSEPGDTVQALSIASQWAAGPQRYGTG